MGMHIHSHDSPSTISKLLSSTKPREQLASPLPEATANSYT
jgi:hypothetical protein